jgi:alpha/beta hydrolase fold
MLRTGRRAAHGRWFGPALTVSAAALLAVTACSSSSSSTATTKPSPAAAGVPDSGSIIPTQSPRWSQCRGVPAQAGVRDCTMLSVPLNYADPGGRRISLAVDMVPATAPKSQQQGIMLVNPGGPGASGLGLAEEVEQGLSPGVAADYDIVGFDPRGVGSSVPSLSCDPSFFSTVRPNYIPANAAAEQVLINRAETYADDCEQKYGWLLPHMTTEDMARDMRV